MGDYVKIKVQINFYQFIYHLVNTKKWKQTENWKHCEWGIYVVGKLIYVCVLIRYTFWKFISILTNV